MKILFILLCLILSLGRVFAENANPAIGSYEFYTKSVEGFCKPTTPDLWSGWKENSLITIEQVKYADITKKEDGDKAYKDYLSKIKADPSKIWLLWLKPGPAFVEKASYVYKETMSRIYACAVLNAKIRITDTLLTMPATQSNLKSSLQKQLSYMRNKTNSDGCREVKSVSGLAIKKILLDNTTYQYCNYRQYLYYLDTASKNALDVYYKASKSTTAQNTNLLQNTDTAALEIARSASKITQEIAHAKEVYPQAMVAFSEFEKTYGSHIVLQFILQDYVSLRDSSRSS